MQINYNVHHKLLDYKPLSELTSKNMLITWLVWCQVMHICYHSKDKQIHLYMNQLAKDYKCSRNTIRASVRFLEGHGLIECIIAYDRKSNSPGVYILSKACIRIAQNLYQKRSKPGSPRDQVNNPKKGLKRDESLFNGDPLSNEETKPARTLQEDVDSVWEIQRQSFK